jgi:transposase
MEDWVTIRNLRAKNQKMSSREIARLLGISHHTVKAALERESPPAYQRTDKSNPKLDPFREVVSRDGQREEIPRLAYSL